MFTMRKLYILINEYMEQNAKFSFELVKSTEIALRFLCTKKQ